MIKKATNIIVYFSPIFPENSKKSITEKLKVNFQNIFTSEEFNAIIEKEKRKINDNNYFFIGTGGTEDQIASLIDRINYHGNTELTLLSYESNNSLPAAMEIRSYLEKKMNIKCKIMHHSLESWVNKLEQWQNYIDISKKMHESVLGVIGTPSYWLIASIVNYDKIKEKWGLTIKDISLNELIDPILSESKQFEEYLQFSKNLIKNAKSVKVDEKKIISASKVSEQLMKLVKKHNLNAITLECFTLLQKTEITGCYGLSLLNDNGIIAGCEGDIPAAFTMLLAQFITKQKSSFMSNVSNFNIQDNTVTFSHCTVPLGMLVNYEVLTHFETNMSVAIKGSFKENQEITVFKVSGEDLSDWWVSSGKIVSNLSSSSACRTQILVKLNSNVDYFSKSSLANHHIVILGNYEEQIREYLEFHSHF